MSIIPNNYLPPPYILSDNQRGLYERYVNEVAQLYFHNLAQSTASQKVKNKIKSKIGYSSSTDITYQQFQKTLQLLKAYIIRRNPNFFNHY